MNNKICRSRLLIIYTSVLLCDLDPKLKKNIHRSLPQDTKGKSRIFEVTQQPGLELPFSDYIPYTSYAWEHPGPWEHPTDTLNSTVDGPELGHWTRRYIPIYCRVASNQRLASNETSQKQAKHNTRSIHVHDLLGMWNSDRSARFIQ